MYVVSGGVSMVIVSLVVVSGGVSVVIVSLVVVSGGVSVVFVSLVVVSGGVSVVFVSSIVLVVFLIGTHQKTLNSITSMKYLQHVGVRTTPANVLKI